MEEQTQSQTSASKAKSSFNPAVVLGIVVLLLVGGGVYFASSHKSATPTIAQQARVEGIATAAPTAATTIVPTGTASAEKEFTVVGQNYSFSPSHLTVKKGDKVKITFTDNG